IEFFKQRFNVMEKETGVPGEHMTREKTLDGVEEIIGKTEEGHEAPEEKVSKSETKSDSESDSDSDSDSDPKSKPDSGDKKVDDKKIDDTEQDEDESVEKSA